MNDIDTNLFSTPSGKVSFRLLMVLNLFKREDFTSSFIEKFKNNFSTIKEEYDNSTYTFRIKKTKIKKNSNYCPRADFYYPYISSIMYELFTEYENDIINIIINDSSVKTYCSDNNISIYKYAYDTLNAAKEEPIYFADVLCISDNIVQVRV